MFVRFHAHLRFMLHVAEHLRELAQGHCRRAPDFMTVDAELTNYSGVTISVPWLLAAILLVHDQLKRYFDTLDDLIRRGTNFRPYGRECDEGHHRKIEILDYDCNPSKRKHSRKILRFFKLSGR